MAVNFTIIAPEFTKLDSTVAFSGKFMHRADEVVDHMRIVLKDPNGVTKIYNINTYGTYDNAYTQSTSFKMNVPGIWEINYDWVEYPSGNQYPNGKLGYSKVHKLNVIDPNAAKPTIELSPRLSTIKQGDTATYQVTVKGAGPNHKLVGLTWDIGTQKFQGETMSFTTPPMRELGSFDVKAIATFSDGLGGSFVVNDATILTVVSRGLTDVSVMISTNSPQVEYGSLYRLTSSISGAPAGSTVKYEWYVNDVLKGTNAEYTSELVKDLPLEDKVYLLATVISPEGEGITVQSPIIPIKGIPVETWDFTFKEEPYSDKNAWTIGAGTKFYGVVSGYEDATVLFDNVVVSYENIPQATNYDYYKSGRIQVLAPYDINKIGQEFTVKITGTAYALGKNKVHRILSNIPFEREIKRTLTIPSYDSTINDQRVKLDLIVDGVKHRVTQNGTRPLINFEGKAGETISIPISYEFQYLYDEFVAPPIGTAATEMGTHNYDILFKEGRIEVLDFQNKVVGTVKDGVANVTLPNEAKELVGKIRIINDDPKYMRLASYPSGAERSLDIKVRVYPNKMEPTPEMSLSFVPNPSIMNDTYEGIVTVTNAPAGSKVFTKFEDDADYIETDRKTFQAIAMGDRLHSVDVKVTADGFDDYLYTLQDVSTTVGKPWPEGISLNLNPDKLKYVVGENMFIDAVLTAPESVTEDPNSSFSVEWYKDGIAVPSENINRNYDLTWIVNTAGTHVFTCKVAIHNIDYDSGHKLIENQVTITTENRTMAITASISPASGAIKFGESQKLSAVVEGAPVDATIAYVWKVDGVEATPDVGSNGISITVQGDAVKTKKVTLDVTATAEGSETGTASANADVVISKGVQTPFTAVLHVEPDVIVSGQQSSAYVVITNKMAGSTFTYKWMNGSTSSEIVYTGDEPGKVVIKCDITSIVPNYEDLKVNRSKTITVRDNEPVDNEGYFIWPLPHIDAAFMYGNWWALDEIQEITKAGKDWKTETTFKYQAEIDTFKKILKDYNIVMIQESRNGRIIDRQKLESGKIY